MQADHVLVAACVRLLPHEHAHELEDGAFGARDAQEGQGVRLAGEPHVDGVARDAYALGHHSPDYAAHGQLGVE